MKPLKIPSGQLVLKERVDERKKGVGIVETKWAFVAYKFCNVLGLILNFGVEKRQESRSERGLSTLNYRSELIINQRVLI